MSDIRLKITRHKKQEDMTHNRGGRGEINKNRPNYDRDGIRK